MNMTNIRKAIIITLINNGEMTRPELRKKIPIPRTTMFDNLRMLEDNNYVKYEVKSKGDRGRPKSYWSVVKK